LNSIDETISAHAPDPPPNDPKHDHPLPVNSRKDRAPAFLGCHGGAGTSTLAALFPGSADLGSFDSKALLRRGIEGSVILVCKDGVPASSRATEVVNILGFLGQRVDALVVVADAPNRVPAHTRSRLRLLGGRVPAIIFFPYVPQFRYVDISAAPTVRLPKKAHAALGSILAAGQQASAEEPTPPVGS
jgi:hypothetical protein